MPPTKPGSLMKMLHAQSGRVRAIAKAGSAFSKMGQTNREARCGHKRPHEDDDYGGEDEDEDEEEYECENGDRSQQKTPAPKQAKRAKSNPKPNSEPKAKAQKANRSKKPIIESWRPAGGEQPTSKGRKKVAPEPTAVLGIARVSTWRLQFFKPAIDDMIRQHAVYEKMVSTTMVHGGESLTDIYVYFPSANAATKVKDAIDGELLEGRKLQIIYI